MPGVLKRRLGATAALVVLAPTIVLLGRAAVRHGLAWADQAASVASFLVALATFAILIYQLLSSRLSRSPLADIGARQALEDLATALRGQLAAEERLRRVNDPHPLPVRWDVLTAPAGVPGKDVLAGDYDRVLATFDRLPARRLVILGPAGAGKSVLVTRLARDLLEARGEGDPVPVIVPLATWNSGTGLGDWLTDQLISDHPGLGARVRLSTGRTISLAAALLSNGGVLPILDGFDELPAERREQAVKAINAYGSDQPLVLTSRPPEFRRAVTAAGAPISLAAVVRLRRLHPSEVGAYLNNTAHAERWQPVLDRLAREPAGPLVATMTNPLLLWLARTVHEAPESDPGRLASPDWDRAGLETYLLDAFVPAVYGTAERARRAQRRLSFLAAHVERTGTTEFAWWRLQRALRGWFPVAISIRGILRIATVGGVLIWLLAMQGFWERGQYFDPPDGPGLLTTFLAGPIGASFVPVLHAVLEQSGAGDIADEFMGLVSTKTIAWTVVILGLSPVISAMLDGSTGGAEGTPRSIRLRVPRIGRALLGRFFWLSVLISLPVVAFRPLASADTRAAGDETLIALSTVAPVVWLLTAIGYATWPLTMPVDVTRAVSPSEVLRLDRRAFLLTKLVRAVQWTILAWVWCGPTVTPVYLGYAAVTLALRLAAGFPQFLAPVNAGQAYADARLWLAITGRLPWRTMAFLADAHRRGVLRQIGATYQFRHLRLQQHLAAGHPRWADRLRPYAEIAAGWTTRPRRPRRLRADAEARSAGMTVLCLPWGCRRVVDPELPARLDRLRAGGEPVTIGNRVAEVRQTESIDAELLRLDQRTRSRAARIHTLRGADAARRFIVERVGDAATPAWLTWTKAPAAPAPGERIVARLRPHVAELLSGLRLRFLGSLAAAALVLYGLGIAWAAVTLLVIGLANLAYRRGCWRATSFVISDRRLRIVFDDWIGSLGHRLVELPLADVAGVSCVQSPIGVLLGYGRLEIEPVDGGAPSVYEKWPGAWGELLGLGRWRLESAGVNSFRPTIRLRQPLRVMRLIGGAPEHRDEPDRQMSPR